MNWFSVALIEAGVDSVSYFEPHLALFTKLIDAYPAYQKSFTLNA